MRRFLLNSATLYTHRYHYHNHSLHTIKPISIKPPLLPFSSFQSNYEFFSSDNISSSNPFNSTSKTNLTDSSDKEQVSIDDVSTTEFKGMIRKYLENDDEDEEMTAEVMEAILKRRLSKKHEETDDELMDELELRRISKKREETDDELMDELELRRLSKKHEETDDELMDDFELRPIDNASDAKIGSGFEEACETDDEIEDLCNVKEYVEKKMMKDEF